MLTEQQVAELVRRTRPRLGVKLPQVMGNLRRARTRADQVWELLLFDALSLVQGSVIYEPKEKKSPDFLWMRHEKEAVWIEAAYLYPSNEGLVNRARQTEQSLWREAKRRGIDPVKIVAEIPKSRGEWRMEDVNLPAEHQSREFLELDSVVEFFNRVQSQPNEPNEVLLSEYPLAIKYKPELRGQFAVGIGLDERRAKQASSHPVFKKIEEKGRQHSPAGMYLVWIGGQDVYALDQRPFSNDRMITESVIHDAMEKYENISGVIVTGIFTEGWGLRGWRNKATTTLYLNRRARYPVDEVAFATLKRIDLNKWKFGHALSRSDHQASNHLRSLGGVTLRNDQNEGFELEIGGEILAGILAGKFDLISYFGDQVGSKLVTDIESGFTVTDCALVPPDLENGLPARFRLRLSPSADDVFWPRGQNGPKGAPEVGSEECS